MFAKRYFNRYKDYKPLLKAPVEEEVDLFVMIPCFREPDILKTLQSLSECNQPEGITEIFVIINEPENCIPEISSFNRETYKEVQQWIIKNKSEKLRFYTSPPVKLAQKWAGVGMARKRGMDEGLWRFQSLGKPEGIIVSLDADTLVDKNYLTSIEQHFERNPHHVSATIGFLHQLEGLEPKQREGILLYEKYLKYYKEALTYAGYPHALFTIGSAFAVTAEAYMKRGGMTRRKAGEDFYFLQKLTQIGKVGEINETRVHPSARASTRVPFGTGPAMKQWMEGTNDLRYTYNLQAFTDIKQLFSRHTELYRIDKQSYNRLIAQLPKPLTDFLETDNFFEEVSELSANCSTMEIFSERFFHFFNAFKILKYINHAHAKFYQKRLLDEVWAELQSL